jgi:cobalamin biosynthesis protein CobT
MVYYDTNDTHTMSFSNNSNSGASSSVAMKDNYDHIMKLPAVLELQRKISALKQENKILIRILRKTIRDSSMHDKPECDVIDLTLPDTHDAVEGSRLKEDIKCVKIKMEPGLEVSVVEEEKENIQYELIHENEGSSLENMSSAEEEEDDAEEEEDDAEEEEDDAEEEEDDAEEEEDDAVEEEEAAEEEAAEEGEAVEEEEEEEEAEVYEITIKGKKYFTTDEQNGDIYEMDKDGDVGEQVGSFVNGIAKV